MNIFGPKSIKYYVERYLRQNESILKNKICIDIPAGSGFSSKILKDIGAKVESYDLFPELFKVDGLECKKANLQGMLPIKDKYCDFILCQEGIEHFNDQLLVFKEFNRILKQNGKLIITTPNYSNIKSKLSYLFSESEYYNKLMPPNEIDSIWLSVNNNISEIYYGHIFLIGIQKLRILGILCGFKIKKVYPVRINKTSLIWFPFIYPAIIIVNLIIYLKAMKKNKKVSRHKKISVYREILKMNLNPKILIDTKLFVEFEKKFELDEVPDNLHSRHEDFNVTT